MKQYIDKSALAAEIEKIIADETESIKSFEHSKNVSEVQRSNVRLSVLYYIQSFLDVLEVKEMDLEKEIEWIKHIYKVDNNRHTSICSADIEWLAEHFFELGIKATQKGE